MSTGVSRTVLHRLRAAGSAPAASSGSWSRLPSSCCRLPAGPRCEARRALSVPGRGTMNVFNREMKKRQKNWAASLQDGHQYDYLRDEVRAHRHSDVTKYKCTPEVPVLRYWYWTGVFSCCLLTEHISEGDKVLLTSPHLSQTDRYID